MKKIVQVVENIAHWVFEAEERPPYPDDVFIIEITDRDVNEGDIYNPATGEFTRPDPIPEMEPLVPIEEIAEETLLETKYQTLLLEMMI